MHDIRAPGSSRRTMAQGAAPQRPPRRRGARLTALALAAAALAAPRAWAAQETVVWAGTAGSYGTAANWSPAVVPLNGATSTYIVQIGTGKTVNYTVSSANAIDQFLLDVGSAFNLTGTSLIVPTELNVIGRALIAGSISANNASFSALAAGTSILGSTVSFSAANGGVLRIGATGTYSARGLPNATVLSVIGAGSRLELPQLDSFDVGQATGYSNFISVRDQATLSMPLLKTLVAPAANATLAFTVTGASSVDLSSLQTVSGATQDSGTTNFSVDASTLVVGALQKANRMNLGLANGSTLTIGSAAGGAEITNSVFAAAGGSKINGAALVGTLANRGLPNQTIISATGTGTAVDLSGLSLVDVGSASGYSFFVSVTDHAVLKLAGVQTLVAPAANAALLFTVNSGASLDLSGLKFVSGTTQDTGSTNFNLDNASALLGPLQKANLLNLNLQNASTLKVGGYAGATEITNSTFAAAGGSTLNAGGLLGTLNDRGLPNQTIISAAGTATFLNLAGLSSIDVGNATGYSSFVNVSDRAVLNLSGVTTLIAPAANAALAFSVKNGGSLDLSSLNTVQGLTLDTGSTTFALDAGSALLGPLRKASRLTVSAQNGSAVTMGGYAGLADLSNSNFFASGASRVDASALVGTLNQRGLPNTTFIAASNTGTVLDLSGLRSIDYGSASGYSSVVSASSNAALNLSGVTTLVAPAANAALAFNASAGGSIDLSSLQTITNAGGGFVSLNATTGGSMRLHGLSAGSALRINLTDAGSRLNVIGSLGLLTGSSMVAGAGTRVELSGDFSFQQKTASQVDIDAATFVFAGGGQQSLEVGGRHLSTPLANGAFVNDNFAIGELDVGQGASATGLNLVDAFDNGNRGPTEALYLNGGIGNNGLHISAGSVLGLNGLDLYTTENGVWVRINDRFTNGVTQIPYDLGIIVLGAAPIVAVPEPRSWALMALGLVAIAARRRRPLPQP